MLNRRLLRVKTMQCIYAFQQSRESNYELALDQIREHFAEELSIIGNDHKEEVAKKESLVIDYFAHNHKDGSVEVTDENIDEKMLKVGADAVKYYQGLVYDDTQSFRNKMLKETETLYLRYLKFLQYIIDFADYTQKDLENKVERGVASTEKEIILERLFFKNEAVQALRDNVKLSSEVELHKLKRGEDLDKVKEWNKLLRKDNNFFETFSDSERSFDSDKLVVRYFVKDFLLKHDQVEPVFEEEDLSWTENKTILKSMLLKTVKALEEGSNYTELLSISKNWEDDKEFFERLYRLTLQQEGEYDEAIANSSKKWAKDRMAKVDQILLNMALTEMINFPNIPVKVTINEFLEVSKVYSTPKSWQFINGVLDTVSSQFIESGKIKKSGRGLIDNK